MVASLEDEGNIAMKFTMTVEMDTGNDQIEFEQELTSIMQKVGDRLSDARYYMGHTESILDINGNRVGSFKMERL